MSAPEVLDLLDAYNLLDRDDRSRLGWRLLLLGEKPESWEAFVEDALGSGSELADLLPGEYRRRHLEIVHLLPGAKKKDLSEGDVATLAAAISRSEGELGVLLGLRNHRQSLNQNAPSRRLWSRARSERRAWRQPTYSLSA